MSDFDTVLTGTVVLPDRVIERGYVAIAGDKIGAVGDGVANDTAALQAAINAAFAASVTEPTVLQG